MEESHLQHMKALLASYAHSVEDTHVQIGQVSGAGAREQGRGCWARGPWPYPVTQSIRLAQVHEEFKQNIENVSVEMLLRKFVESKGTGREKPGESAHLLGLGCGAPAAGKEEDSRGRRRLSLPVPWFPHWKRALMTNLTPQPIQEEDLRPGLICKSLTTRYH